MSYSSKITASNGHELALQKRGGNTTGYIKFHNSEKQKTATNAHLACETANAARYSGVTL